MFFNVKQMEVIGNMSVENVVPHAHLHVMPLYLLMTKDLTITPPVVLGQQHAHVQEHVVDALITLQAPLAVAVMRPPLTELSPAGSRLFPGKSGARLNLTDPTDISPWVIPRA